MSFFFFRPCFFVFLDKIIKKMRLSLYFFVVLIFALAGCSGGKDEAAVSSPRIDVEEQLQRLDSCIQMKGQFDQEKEKKLAGLKADLKNASGADNQYRVCYQLFNEYLPYNFDSAFYYSTKAGDMAIALNNNNYKVEVGCAIVLCYLSAGLYKEAFDAMQKVSHAGVDDEHQKQYYMMWSRIYYDMAGYNNSPPYEEHYVKMGNLYTDSLLLYVPEQSPDWYYATAQRQMKSHDFSGSTQSFLKMVASNEADAHMLAIAYSCIGWNYWIDGRKDDAIANLVESAIYDIRSSIKENTSTCGLARIIYERGDTKRAVDYAQSALEDANFYGARHRKIEVGSILPILEQDRYRMVVRQRNLSILTAAVSILFIIALLCSIAIIRRQNKKLNKAQKVIQDHNHALTEANERLEEANNRLEETNNRLAETNDRLEEANVIKEGYIGRTLFINSEYINKLEKLFKKIDRKIVARQFDDLRMSLKESTLNEERENMYAVFDETFLKIFPDFVEKYNALFDEKDRRYPPDDHSLTSEMRIFALIRLGISDSSRIASFLNYSVHTVNTYKTRVKNKSIEDNEQFEQKILSL